MSVGGTGMKPAGVRRGRWRLLLGALVVLPIAGLSLAAYVLQPARLTALIIGRASNALHLELKTDGAGSYALRPEPRLVLLGLSARMPGASTPFFRSDRVELALPWDTLRGRGTDISSIVLKSPDLDLPELQRWLATFPPTVAPFKLPRLKNGLHVQNGTLRGTNWRIEHLDVALPSLADGKPAQLDAGGDLVRVMSTSKFTLSMLSTPISSGRGLRIDHVRMAFNSNGELPSLTATGSLLASDTFALDLTGTIQRIPTLWAASIDSAFAHPGGTPFAIVFGDRAPLSTSVHATPVPPQPQDMQLRLMLGDPKRQPALTLTGESTRGKTQDTTLHGHLSRWPDAWPQLPASLASGQAPIVFDASYHGPFVQDTPIAFNVNRADASLHGRFRMADLRAWIAGRFTALLSPIEAMLRTPRIDLGNLQPRSTQMRASDAAVEPMQPAATRRLAPK
jgi:hypothetical protein